MGQPEESGDHASTKQGNHKTVLIDQHGNPYDYAEAHTKTKKEKTRAEKLLPWSCAFWRAVRKKSPQFWEALLAAGLLATTIYLADYAVKQWESMERQAKASEHAIALTGAGVIAANKNAQAAIDSYSNILVELYRLKQIRLYLQLRSEYRDVFGKDHFTETCVSRLNGDPLDKYIITLLNIFKCILAFALHAERQPGDKCQDNHQHNYHVTHSRSFSAFSLSRSVAVFINSVHDSDGLVIWAISRTRRQSKQLPVASS